MARTLQDEAEDSLYRYCRERGAQMRPDDPVWAQLQSVGGNISTMGNRIEFLERENRQLKEEIERLKGKKR